MQGTRKYQRNLALSMCPTQTSKGMDIFKEMGIKAAKNKLVEVKYHNTLVTYFTLVAFDFVLCIKIKKREKVGGILFIICHCCPPLP